MSYLLKFAEASVKGKDKYTIKGKTQCVAFVQQAAGAPLTAFWRPGKRIKDSKPGEILRGTAIATFDENGRYPTDGLGKHAAIYLSHDDKAIQVLDQWESQHEVRPRPIRFDRPKGTRRSNDGDTFYVIE